MSDDSPKMGRPPIEIDWKQFEILCRMHCTEEEFAYWFKCSVDTIARACQEKYGKTFAEVFKERSVGGRISLRRNLWQQAEGKQATFDKEGNMISPFVKPNLTAQIFLSKQAPERGGLGFSDKVVNEHEAGAGTYEKLLGVIDELEAKKAAETK